MIICIFSHSWPFRTNFCLKRSHNCIFSIFLQFLMNFLLRVGLERNGVIIFIFPVFQSILTYYSLKWSHNGSFYYASGWNGTERYFLFSLFLNVSPLILAWNEAIIVFYNFFNFFPIFFEFPITCRIGTKQNNNFYFLSFLAFLNIFLL